MNAASDKMDTLDVFEFRNEERKRRSMKVLIIRKTFLHNLI